MNIPLIQSNNPISIPLLNQYPLIKSSSSILSFDSQIELDEFHQMSSIND